MSYPVYKTWWERAIAMTSLSLSALGMVFVVLKLAGVIDWSWWTVTWPWWGIALFLFALSVINRALRILFP